MKRQVFIYGFSLVSFIACQDNLMIPEADSSKANFDVEGIYPSSVNFGSNSRSLCFEADWENMNQAPTALDPIDLPWGNISDSNLPEDFAKDIKKEDGWKFIYHTFNSYNPKMRYMIFLQSAYRYFESILLFKYK